MSGTGGLWPVGPGHLGGDREGRRPGTVGVSGLGGPREGRERAGVVSERLGRVRFPARWLPYENSLQETWLQEAERAGRPCPETGTPIAPG